MSELTLNFLDEVGVISYIKGHDFASASIRFAAAVC
jgi:hypothetical protein